MVGVASDWKKRKAVLPEIVASHYTLRCRGLLQLCYRVKQKRLIKIVDSYVPGWNSRYSDSLRAGRPGDRIPGEVRFSAPVQTGPGTHPASYTMGTGSFPGGKAARSGVDHPPPSRAEVEGRVELYICSPFGPSRPVLKWTLLYFDVCLKFRNLCPYIQTLRHISVWHHVPSWAWRKFTCF